MRRAVAFAVLATASLARADFPNPATGEVAVRDVPGTNRHWQEAHTIIDAPPEAVKRWINEFEYWPGRFRDVRDVRVIERSASAAKVWVDSKIMRQLVL